jgi:hypothetical protein
LKSAAVHIKGLKISGEHCLIRLHKTSPATDLLPAFCQMVTGSRINLPLISSTHQAGGIQAACCVDAAHQDRIEQLLDNAPLLKPHVSYNQGVGMLTLFPHQSSLSLFGLSLHGLLRENIRVLGLASSIGALTYILDYVQLEKAASVLKRHLNLDGNHSPFKAELALPGTHGDHQGPWRRPVETVAMYCEPTIKTYGFHTINNLALYKYVISSELSFLPDVGPPGIKDRQNCFHLLCGQLNDNNGIDLLLLCESAHGSTFVRQVESMLPVDATCRREAERPVELLLFQGPHFGDRFGIADFTYRALGRDAHRLPAAVFSCASVYLVLPEGAAQQAEKRLASAFTIPC